MRFPRGRDSPVRDSVIPEPGQSLQENLLDNKRQLGQPAGTREFLCRRHSKNATVSVTTRLSSQKSDLRREASG